MAKSRNLAPISLENPVSVTCCDNNSLHGRKLQIWWWCVPNRLFPGCTTGFLKIIRGAQRGQNLGSGQKTWNLIFHTKFNYNGGSRKQLLRFGDSQAHKIMLKHDFLGSAVMSNCCDMTAKPKNSNFNFILWACKSPNNKSCFLLPPLELNFEYHIKFRAKVGILNGTQNLASLHNLLSTLLTVKIIGILHPFLPCHCYTRATHEYPAFRQDSGPLPPSPVSSHLAGSTTNIFILC